MTSLKPIGEPTSRDSRVTGAIAQAAARTGMDFSYLYNQAKVESGLDPNAKAGTSTATGLFQFTQQTWLATLKQHGAYHGLGWATNAITQNSDGHFRVSDPALRDNILDLRKQPEAAAAMAAEFASDNQSFLEQRIDREIEPVDLYLAHFLGAGGAARFLKAHNENPSAAAAPLFPRAAAANHSVFYAADGRTRSLDEIRSRFARKIDSDAPTNRVPPIATAQVNTSSQASDSAEDRRLGLSLQSIEPMPTRLSLDFARRVYTKLERLTSDSLA
jgi:Transglycosylase SLT domain